MLFLRKISRELDGKIHKKLDGKGQFLGEGRSWGGMDI